MQISDKWKKHWVLDVESDGPCPGLYNMINFGLVNVFDPSLSHGGFILPPDVMNEGGIPAARNVSGVKWEDQLVVDYTLPDVMKYAQEFLTSVSDSDRVTIWSDNPAFDWQFWNYYTHKYNGENCAGFSARRIGDMDAGRRKDPFNTNAWKKRRVTDHSHNPVDDARGNVEALRWILEQM